MAARLLVLALMLSPLALPAVEFTKITVTLTADEVQMCAMKGGCYVITKEDLAKLRKAQAELEECHVVNPRWL